MLCHTLFSQTTFVHTVVLSCPTIVRPQPAEPSEMCHITDWATITFTPSSQTLTNNTQRIYFQLTTNTKACGHAPTSIVCYGTDDPSLMIYVSLWHLFLLTSLTLHETWSKWRVCLYIKLCHLVSEYWMLHIVCLPGLCSASQGFQLCSSVKF